MHLSTLVLTLLLFSPSDDPIVIKNATLISAPGKKGAKATLLLRGGLIRRVGGAVQIPSNAKVLDGKGLFVYAGFIDSHTQYGLPQSKRAPEQRKRAEGRVPDFTRTPLFGMQDANRKGIRPHRRAADILQPTAADAKKWRAGGFTTVVAAPGNEYLSGSSAIVVLSNDTRRFSILSAQWGMHASFRSYGEGYPRTLMGTFAHFRQLFEDARHYRIVWKSYRENPRGKRRPPFDPALEALFPVMDRRQPVVFHANTENEIHRALDLARELNFRVLISGGAEAYKLVDRLKNVPVLLTLKLPKEPDKKKKKEEDRPKKLLREERRLRKERAACAVALHKAGIAFAFTTEGIEPREALKSIRRLVKLGLPKAGALRALTTTPAQFQNLTEVGTLARGKIANLTVLTAPLGSPKAKVRFVVTDGRLFEFDVKKGGKKATVNVTGKWEASVGSLTVKITLKQDGNSVDGTFSSRYGDMKVTGTVSGSTLDLTGAVDDGEMSITAEVKGRKMTGTYSSSWGEGKFSAKKPEANRD